MPRAGSDNKDFENSAPEFSEATPEQKEILASASAFAEYMASRYPQAEKDENNATDKDKWKLNYTFAGSLGTSLMASAELFTEFELDQDSNIILGKTREIPAESRKILAGFARPINDFDFVRSGRYKQKSESLRHDPKDPEAYSRARSKFLYKGGGGPSFDEIPETAKKCLKIDPKSEKLMCDPVEPYGPKRGSKVRVGNFDYMVSRPDEIIGYKVLHLVQQAQGDLNKFNDDFPKLLKAFSGIYSEAELLEAARQAIDGWEKMKQKYHDLSEAEKTYPQKYQPNSPGAIKNLVANENLSPVVKEFIGKLLQENNV